MRAHMPGISVSISCDHCGTDVVSDSESFHCPVCDITWETGDPFEEDANVVFGNKDAEPCGEPPSDATLRVEVYGIREYTFTPLPCQLPTGHGSRHYRPEKVTSRKVEGADDGQH